MEQKKLSTTTSLFGAAILLLALGVTDNARADVFTVELPEFERLYGGFVGDTFQETDYDFGVAFLSVTSATLHLEGFTDIPDSTVSFLVELEGVNTPQVDLLVLGSPPLFPPYTIDIPLLFDGSVLDGMGDISMNVNTAGPGFDLSTTVQLATLTFEGKPVPTPSVLTLLALGAVGVRRKRKRAAQAPSRKAGRWS